MNEKSKDYWAENSSCVLTKPLFSRIHRNRFRNSELSQFDPAFPSIYLLVSKSSVFIHLSTIGYFNQ